MRAYRICGLFFWIGGTCLGMYLSSIGQFAGFISGFICAIIMKYFLDKHDEVRNLNQSGREPPIRNLNHRGRELPRRNLNRGRTDG